MLAGLFAQQPAAQTKAAPTPTLSYEFFKTQVQPIFLKKRPGHARCIACHGQETTPLDLAPLRSGRTTLHGRRIAEELRGRQSLRDAR
jgi:hypothetical protein